MSQAALLSPETNGLVAEYHRGLLIKDSLPDIEQVIALTEAKTANNIVEAVAKRCQKEAAVIALQQGRQLIVDFCSGDTAITLAAIQRATAELNSSGYSLLVGKISSNHYRLSVKKHSSLGKRQSRLLWAAPDSVRFIIGQTWERAWSKIRGVTSEDNARNAAIDYKTWENEEHLRGREAQALKYKREWGERSISTLPKGVTGYTVPWALSRNEDGSYCLNALFPCVNRRMGTCKMPVRWTPEGPMVLLPTDFNYRLDIEEGLTAIFESPLNDFEWVLVNYELR